MVSTVDNGLILIEALGATATRTLATVVETAERSSMMQRFRDAVWRILEENLTTTHIDVMYTVCVRICHTISTFCT